MYLLNVPCIMNCPFSVFSQLYFLKILGVYFTHFNSYLLWPFGFTIHSHPGTP